MSESKYKIINNIILRFKNIEKQLAHLSRKDRYKCDLYSSNFISELKIYDNEFKILSSLGVDFSDVWFGEIVSEKIREYLDELNIETLNTIYNEYDPLNKAYKEILDKEVEKILKDDDFYTLQVRFDKDFMTGDRDKFILCMKTPINYYTHNTVEPAVFNYSKLDGYIHEELIWSLIGDLSQITKKVGNTCSLTKVQHDKSKKIIRVTFGYHPWGDDFIRSW